MRVPLPNLTKSSIKDKTLIHRLLVHFCQKLSIFGRQLFWRPYCFSTNFVVSLTLKTKIRMKKLVILCLAIVASVSFAFGNGIFNPLVFNIRPLPPKPGDIIIPIGGNPRPKSPVQAPDVYLEENILTFDEAIEGCTIQLVDEEEDIVFSDFIDENQTSLTLPSYLSGTYELQIITDSYIFYCEIELQN